MIVKGFTSYEDAFAAMMRYKRESGGATRKFEIRMANDGDGLFGDSYTLVEVA